MTLFKPFFCASISVILLLMGCGSDSKRVNNKTSPRIKSVVSVVSPKNNIKLTIGAPVTFAYSSRDENIKIDSVILLVNGIKKLVSFTSKTYNWDTQNSACGQFNITAKVYLSNATIERKRSQINLVSDIEPTQYTYRIINTYPHDKTAYTQGLIMDDGRLYESTGRNGESSLREVDLQSGKVIRSTSLSSQYFGEGIAIQNNDIYYLTWTSREVIVFDKINFNEKRRHNFNTEGWGLSSMGDTLIMSDGSATLRFINPVDFSEIETIQVADKKGTIDALNELEYINGLIFANRYQTDQIYMIDPSNGKVTGILDLEGIIDPTTYTHTLDVLNGIAYNADRDTYYITGKWWPLLFEIRLISKNNS